MQRRNEPMFRRMEQLMGDGLDYGAAFVLAFNEWIEALADRADTECKREREERP